MTHHETQVHINHSHRCLVRLGRRIASAGPCRSKDIGAQRNLQGGDATADPVMHALIVIAERLRQRPYPAVLLQYRLNRKDDRFTHGVKVKPFHGVNQHSV